MAPSASPEAEKPTVETRSTKQPLPDVVSTAKSSEAQAAASAKPKKSSLSGSSSSSSGSGSGSSSSSSGSEDEAEPKVTTEATSTKDSAEEKAKRDRVEPMQAGDLNDSASKVLPSAKELKPGTPKGVEPEEQ